MMRFFSKIIQIIWLLFVVFLVLIALAITAARLFSPNIQQYKESIVHQLNTSLPISVKLDHLSVQWHGLSPILYLRNLTISNTDIEKPLVIDAVEIKLNLISSLLQQKLVTDRLLIRGMQLHLIEQENGRWYLPGWSSESTLELDEITQLLSSQDLVGLSNITLTMHNNSAQVFAFHAHALNMIRDNNNFQFAGEINYSDKLQSNIPINIIINTQGDLQLDDFNAQAYIGVKNISASHVLTNIFPSEQFAIDNLLINDVALWLQWESGRLADIRGRISMPTLSGQYAEKVGVNEEDSITDFSADFAWKSQNDNHWLLSLNNLSFNWLSHEWAPAHWQINFSQNQFIQTYTSYMSDIAIEPIKKIVTNWFDLDDKYIAIINQLEPKGSLLNSKFTYNRDECDVDAFSLAGQLHNVSISSWKNIPASSGINGQVYLNSLGGKLNLQSNNLNLSFPNFFRDGWVFDHAQGEIRWRYDKEHVIIASQVIHIENEFIDVNGKFRLDLWRDETPDTLALIIGLKDGNANYASKLIPAKKLKPRLVNWLDEAIISGNIQQGLFLYHGEIKKQSVNTIQQFYDVTQAEVKFHPDWPSIKNFSGQVLVDNKNAKVTLQQGTLFDSEIKQAFVEIEADGSQSKINITGRLLGSASDGLKMLRTTTLRQTINDQLDQWQLTGGMQVDLDLLMMLDNNLISYKPIVQVGLDNCQLTIKDLDISLSKIDGVINYSNSQGLFAKNIKSVFFDHPATLNIKSHGEKYTKTSDMSVDVKGVVKTKRLQQWLNQDCLMQPWLTSSCLVKIDGKIKYDAELRLRGNKSYLQVTSDLQDLAVPFPYPFGKKKGEKKSFYYLTSLEGDVQHAVIQYGSNINATLVTNKSGLQGGHIHFGRSQSQHYQLPGYTITGHLPYIDFDAWSQYIESSQGLDAEKSTTQHGSIVDKVQRILGEDKSRLLRQLEMDVGYVKLSNKKYHSIKMQLSQEQNHWNMILKSPVLSGKAKWFYQNVNPHEVSLDYLFSPVNDGKSDLFSAIDPYTIPAIDFSTDAFFYGKEDYGSWSFKLRPYKEGNKEGLRLSDISGRMKEMDVVGILDWLKEGEQYATYIDSVVRAIDTSDVLDSWGYAPSIVSQKLKSVLKIHWPGSPINVTKQNLKGYLYIKVEDGEFVDTGSRTDLLRVLGILNLNTFARRLRLDFSDLFGAGMSYDKIKGEFAIDNGKILIEDVLEVEGPSANIQLMGHVDFVSGQLEQEMIVILPITSNLPMAAVIAGAPQVGGIIYLADKILSITPIGKVIDRLTTATYTVKGGWDDPDVELIKVFSEKAAVE